jgi:bifunctional ADP-heptose synthase (sugar kinase/adenylyltransferase)
MDTRKKILSLDEAAAVASTLRAEGRRLRLLCGHFDVLTAHHIRRLRGLADGQPLIAAVLDAPKPLLSLSARAELAAALSMIDYVIPMTGDDFDRALEQIQPSEVVREEAADRHRVAALIEHVHRRQRA